MCNSDPPSDQRRSFLILPTNRLPKARTCITSMYHHIDGRIDGRYKHSISKPASTNLTDFRPLPGWMDDLPDVLAIEFEPNGCAVLL